MIDILLDRKHEHRLINPSALELVKQDQHRYRASWWSGNDRHSEDVCQATESAIFPATPSQRIWEISNTSEDGKIDLWATQYRVLGFRYEKDLTNDMARIIPITIGLQSGVYPIENRFLFLVDMELRTVTQISAEESHTLAIDEETTNGDILDAIRKAMKIDSLTVEQLPVELMAVFQEEYLYQKTGTR